MMTFAEALIASGYVFDDENYDGCYVKQTDTLWNYVKMSDDFDVISEVTFNPDNSTLPQ